MLILSSVFLMLDIVLYFLDFLVGIYFSIILMSLHNLLNYSIYLNNQNIIIA